MFKSILIPALVLGIPAALGAADPPRFSGTAEVTVIEIPVQVSKDGEPVRGLTGDDFEVTENGDRVPIANFEVIDLAVRRPDGGLMAIPVAARRHFLFLFDFVFSEPKSIVDARRAALEVLRDALHPSDLAAVATYAPNGAEVVLGFTSDRNQVAAAIASLGAAPEQFKHSPDPLGLTVSSTVNDLADYFGASSGLSGRAGGALSDTFRSYSRLTVQSERNSEVESIVDLSQALADLAQQMGALEGRKHVLYLSQGFSNRALVGTETGSVRRIVDIERGNVADVDNEQKYGSSRAQNSLEVMLEAFRRANCVVHTIDIAGARAGGDVQGDSAADGIAGNKDGLVAMARSTGGDFYDEFNDLGAAFGQLVEKTSVTYLLTIQPNEVRPDGKYHKLKVKLKNGRGGATLTHRSGFFAPDPKRPTSALETRFESAEKILSGDVGGSIVSAALALPFRVPGQPAYVPVLVEIDGRSLLQGVTGNTLAAELYVYALSEEGRVLDYFVQNLALDLEKVRPALEASGLKFYGHLDLPPGRPDLRVLVENRTAGTHSLEAATLTVPALASETPFLLPPVFAEPMGRWLLVRESAEQQQERELPFPFFAEGRPYLPALTPRFAAGAPIDFQILGHGLGGELQVDAKLLAADSGAPQGIGALSVLERGQGLGDADQLSVRLEAPELAAGRYVLQLTVTDRTTGLTVVSSAGVEIVK